MHLALIYVIKGFTLVSLSLGSSDPKSEMCSIPNNALNLQLKCMLHLGTFIYNYDSCNDVLYV